MSGETKDIGTQVSPTELLAESSAPLSLSSWEQAWSCQRYLPCVLFQIAAVWIIAVTLAVAAPPVYRERIWISLPYQYLCLLRRSKSFSWSKVVPYILAQTTGCDSWFRSQVVMYASLITEFEAIQYCAVVGRSDCVGAGVWSTMRRRDVYGLFCEMFGTAVLAGYICLDASGQRYRQALAFRRLWNKALLFAGSRHSLKLA
jgi:hypothetical protein